MPKNKNSNILDVIRGIHQAAFNGSDFYSGIVEDEDKDKVGLKREEGNPILDSRIIDGFSVSIAGDILKVRYHGEIDIKDVQEKKFENNLEDMIEQIVKFLKKEYKNLTGKTLSLSPTKDPMNAIVQSTSKVRTWVLASKMYKISNVDLGPDEDEMEKKFRNNFKDWIKQQEEKGKKPKNVKISEKDNQKEKEKE